MHKSDLDGNMAERWRTEVEQNQSVSQKLRNYCLSPLYGRELTTNFHQNETESKRVVIGRWRSTTTLKIVAA